MLFKLCNNILSFKPMLLADSSQGSEELAKKFSETIGGVILEIFNYILLGISALSVGFAVFCAIKMFMADNEEKRDNAKKRLIYTVVAVVIVVALFLILTYVRKNIDDWVPPFKTQTD